MNADLEDLMNSEESEKLFFYYKHDGTVDFEKKIIAGKILNKRNFDREKLLQEKQLIVDSINDKITYYNNTIQLTAKNKKKINKGLLFVIGYFSFFIILVLKDYIMNKETFDWAGIFVITLVVVIFMGYKLITYKSKLKQLLESDMDDNELLKFRLQLIEKEWDF